MLSLVRRRGKLLPRLPAAMHRRAGLLAVVAMCLAQILVASPATRLLVTNDACALGSCPPEHVVPQVFSGASFTLAVLAVDDSGNADASYSGTVRLSSSDPLASLSAGYAFTAADAGRHGFEVTLSGLGSQTITAEDTAGAILPATVTLIVHPTGPCVSSSDSSLCLGSGRFVLTAQWRASPDLALSAGHAVSITGNSGYFWFFDPTNIELVVKVLIGCPINDQYWVFAGGLTDVDVELAAMDTLTGAVKTYTNDAGTRFQPIQDSSAFSCP